MRSAEDAGASAGAECSDRTSNPTAWEVDDVPQIIDNEDGSKTLTINSNELRELRNLLDRTVPGFKQVVSAVDAPGVRATVDFLKAALR